MLAQSAALGEGETIGIAIDLADCVVGMSPARRLARLNWGSDGGGSIRLQSSSGRTEGQAAVAEQAGRRGRGISSHQSWPSKQAN